MPERSEGGLGAWTAKMGPPDYGLLTTDYRAKRPDSAPRVDQRLLERGQRFGYVFIGVGR